MDYDGLSAVLSPVQLAAILSSQHVSEAETLSNRLWGGLKLMGGSLEMVGAAALLLVPEPTMATKVGGVALSAHGSDTISAGFWQVWTGKQQRTLTDQAAAALALRLGAERGTAESFGTAVDIAVPLAVSVGVGAARLASIRFGRIQLAENEGALGSKLGGHTIAKHVGKSEAELRARLVLEPYHKHLSTFSSLDVAERTIYQGIRANKGAIEAWALTAKANTTQRFFYTANETVGSVLVAATNQVHQVRVVRVVLKMQAFNGKLYYILTAFPQL